MAKLNPKAVYWQNVRTIGNLHNVQGRAAEKLLKKFKDNGTLEAELAKSNTQDLPVISSTRVTPEDIAKMADERLNGIESEMVALEEKMSILRTNKTQWEKIKSAF